MTDPLIEAHLDELGRVWGPIRDELYLLRELLSMLERAVAYGNLQRQALEERVRELEQTRGEIVDPQTPE